MEKVKKLIEISKQILKDFEREFFEDTFDLRSPKELKEWWGDDYKFQFDVWYVYIKVPHEQFGGQGTFLICFKDENLEPFMFHDFGAPGRTPDLTIIKKNGKYAIGDEWKNE